MKIYIREKKKLLVYKVVSKLSYQDVRYQLL